jgi:dynein heavy chain, axonemal
LTTVGKQIILYGGLDNQKSKNGKIEPSKDIYVLKIGNNNNYEWRLQTTSGDAPFPRTNHAACSIAGDKMLVFGGYYSTNQRYNDTYILKTTSKNWYN